ncbi:DUF485 domain-containing protein [Neobacillus sp. MM2021_6]|uniref:DUF485 domain-containing protein n=1 Tax=Bacillaceae TaxID=186817 RepID=UPI00140C99EF|nr:MULTISPECIES: DUF485 domain-containing protein [Bacillaceae]MBO0962461.1 DUF485 domain-containing protein [Neobacillus sp. MM2021_6]NHC18976.1 DUF485 domain-containing protein [Bacillus sp. MM2020_4]WML40944.1 DUF485 domain-containing protein [Neobacillus sp. OS1-2]
MEAQKSKDYSESDYSSIAQSSSFQALLSEKKKFIIPITIFFFCFYFALPILTSYSTVLNHKFIGSITWAWVFAFLQFVMTWGLCMLYSKKAAKFDDLANNVIQKGVSN